MATVLVIDDDWQTCELISAVLRSLGVEVTCAPGSDIGLEMMRQNRPTVAIVDLLLPVGSGVDGWQTIEIIKGDGALSQTPIIALTAVHSPTNRQRAFDSGCDEFMQKPFDTAELRELVRRYL